MNWLLDWSMINVLAVTMQLRQTLAAMAARTTVPCPHVLSALGVHRTVPSNPALSNVYPLLGERAG
jgi:hypothetical protein